MRTIVITGGTSGIGRALAEHYRERGERVEAVGSARADLSSVAATDALAEELLATCPRIDALVLGAFRYPRRRELTADGFERTFAMYVVSRYLLAERLRPVMPESSVILNLCGVGGLPMGRLHWDDLSLEHGFRPFTATMQGARANDLLGVGFASRPGARYVLYNPGFVNTAGTRERAGVVARLLGQRPAAAIRPMVAVLDEPPLAPLTALVRGWQAALPEGDADRLVAAIRSGLS